MNIEEFRERIGKCLLTYGYLPLLLYQEELLLLEDYELCQAIKEVIEEHNELLQNDLPTQYNQEAIDYYFKSFKEIGLSGENSYSKIPEYLQNIKQLLK